MKTSLFLPLLGLLTLSEASDSCSSGLHFETDYTNIRYDLSCLDAHSLADFGVCVAQRNSFNKLLQCAGLRTSSAWVATVPPNSFLDRTANPDYDSDDDSEFSTHDEIFQFTPKQILATIANAQRCPGFEELGDSFDRCPFQDATSFVDCLCCQRVELRELVSLWYQCIYPRPNYPGDWWVFPHVLDSHGPAVDYTCRKACERPRRLDGLCPYPSFEDPRDFSDGCLELVRNGVPQLPPRGLRRDVEGEIDYSSLFEQYPIWVTDSPMPAPTRSIPTVSSRTYDFAYESDYTLATVSEGERDYDDVVSTTTAAEIATAAADTTTTAADTTATAADTTAAAADTTAAAADTTGSDEPNVGAVFSSTDHTVLAFGLALVNLYHAMA